VGPAPGGEAAQAAGAARHCSDPSVAPRASVSTRFRFVLEDFQLFGFAFA
jgi:hypothetical protein